MRVTSRITLLVPCADYMGLASPPSCYALLRTAFADGALAWLALDGGLPAVARPKGVRRLVDLSWSDSSKSPGYFRRFNWTVSWMEFDSGLE
jgi:hypothetical protein